MNKFLEAALKYVRERRWKVFPLEPGGFMPVRIGGTDDEPIRFETGGASNHPTRIRQWWKEWPEANIGLALRESGLVVFCAPNYLPADIELGRLFIWLAIDGALDSATIVCSFTGQKLVLIKATGNIDGFFSKRPEVQVDGYILLPPSRHGIIATYSWDDDTKPVASAPEWLIEE